MKKIEAFIRHEAFEPIRIDLLELGFPSLSISEVKGSGRQKGIVETYRGAEYQIDFVPKVRLQIVTDDDRVDDIVSCITNAAATGKIGDGKIWVTEVDRVIRIRTGDEGSDAI